MDADTRDSRSTRAAGVPAAGALCVAQRNYSRVEDAAFRTHAHAATCALVGGEAPEPPYGVLGFRVVVR